MISRLLRRTGFIPVLLPSLLFGQSLVINEVVSSNQFGLTDEDGDRPDWIELYNSSTDTVALSSYSLSDDALNPNKWLFSTGQVEPGEHSLVYASGKDRHGNEQSWNLILGEGSEWQYFVGSSEPPAGWKSYIFNDSNWLTGQVGIGYGDNDDNTTIAQTLSLYLRKKVNISDPHDLARLLFHMDFDDGYIAYLNGVEFWRENMGDPGTPAYYNTVATTYTEPILPYGGKLDPIVIPPELIQDGWNILAIQVHNSGSQSSDLTALPFLSVNNSAVSGTSPPEYLLMPPNFRNHTNFRLSSDGESIYLSQKGVGIIDSLHIPALPADISYGAYPDGSRSYYYFPHPTPLGANANGVEVLAGRPDVSPLPGFYPGPITLDLGVPPTGLIYTYTLDGTEPTLDSQRYISPISIESSTPLRVLVSSVDGSNQQISSYSYFINEQTHLPVVSLIFEPADFFAEDSGIYASGPGASPDFPHFGANFWEDWERPIHIEYFQDGQTLSYSAGAGAKIFGAWSRGFAQKSIALFARSKYGNSEFDYPFFNDLDIGRFEALVLRNSGNDWNYTGMRDGMMTGLSKGRGLEHQAFQPVDVYLNGFYWGRYNLREKINEHFLASHFNIDPEDIDLLQSDVDRVHSSEWWWAIHGDATDFLDLMDFVEVNDLQTSANYEYVQERIDIQNFIDYQMLQIYFDNRDWPGNNIKLWRNSQSRGKWRWILYDTDFGFGIWNRQAYADNTLQFALDPSGPHWPNPPWSTLLLRKLLTNPEFKREFILTACDLMNGTFLPDRVNGEITRIFNNLQPGIEEHFARWNHNSLQSWESNVNVLRLFGNYRLPYLTSHLQQYFNLGDLRTLTLYVAPNTHGKVRINTLTLGRYPWSGEYFEGIPLHVEAIPAPGYLFSHWSENGSTDPTLTITLEGDMTLTANFVPASVSNDIVINEINYHSADAFDSGDWLELVNAGPDRVNLSGWTLKDANQDNSFVIESMQLDPGAYLVLVHDSLLFRNIHASHVKIAGNVGFNFSNGGEILRLYDHNDVLVDSVRYDDEAPWPTEPDGSGATLELLHHNLDNGDVESWASSTANLGTPGSENSQFTVSTEPELTTLPEKLKISRTFPNPTNASLTVAYEIASQGDATLDIFNIRGELILSIAAADIQPGHYEFVWDGRDDHGFESPSGMYIVRLSQARMSDNAKVVIIR